nr:MAG: hypothetical protein [Bacteriophage sp.]
MHGVLIRRRDLILRLLSAVSLRNRILLRRASGPAVFFCRLLGLLRPLGGFLYDLRLCFRQPVHARVGVRADLFDVRIQLRAVVAALVCLGIPLCKLLNAVLAQLVCQRLPHRVHGIRPVLYLVVERLVIRQLLHGPFLRRRIDPYRVAHDHAVRVPCDLRFLIFDADRADREVNLLKALAPEHRGGSLHAVRPCALRGLSEAPLRRPLFQSNVLSAQVRLSRSADAIFELNSFRDCARLCGSRFCASCALCHCSSLLSGIHTCIPFAALISSRASCFLAIDKPLSGVPCRPRHAVSQQPVFCARKAFTHRASVENVPDVLRVFRRAHALVFPLLGVVLADHPLREAVSEIIDLPRIPQRPLLDPQPVKRLGRVEPCVAALCDGVTDHPCLRVRKKVRVVRFLRHKPNAPNAILEACNHGRDRDFCPLAFSIRLLEPVALSDCLVQPLAVVPDCILHGHIAFFDLGFRQLPGVVLICSKCLRLAFLRFLLCRLRLRPLLCGPCLLLHGLPYRLLCLRSGLLFGLPRFLCGCLRRHLLRPFRFLNGLYGLHACLLRGFSCRLPRIPFFCILVVPLKGTHGRALDRRPARVPRLLRHIRVHALCGSLCRRKAHSVPAVLVSRIHVLYVLLRVLRSVVAG